MTHEKLLCRDFSIEIYRPSAYLFITVRVERRNKPDKTGPDICELTTPASLVSARATLMTAILSRCRVKSGCTREGSARCYPGLLELLVEVTRSDKLEGLTVKPSV